MFRIKCFSHTFLTFLFISGFFLSAAFACAQSRFPQRTPISSSSQTESKGNASSFADTQQRRLTVEKTALEQTEFSVILIITFNIPINPKSITPSSILINKTPLDSKVLIKFNRVGNEVHIFIPIDKIHEIDSGNDKKLLVHINKITAYDGSIVDGRSIENLEFSVAYR